MVALCRIDRTQDEQVGFILDLPGGIARRSRNIGDAGIAWIGRIQFAFRHADDALIRTGRAECRSVGECLHPIDAHLRDARLTRRRGRNHAEQRQRYHSG